jgi:pilus assembly protein Flp/PilA
MNIMLNLKGLVAKIRRSQNEEGQGLVEYALILVLVAIVVIAVMITLGPAISGVYGEVVCRLDTGGCAGPYIYGTDIFNEAQACAQVGLTTGATVYTYASRVPTQNGDEFWITSKKAPPKQGFQVGYTWTCP